MGRKIPGRKHKGIKDPLKQLAKRNAELQDKINKTPTNIDFQELPKSVERLSKLTQAIADGTMPLRKKKKKKRNKKSKLFNTDNFIEKETKLPGMTKPDKPVPSFVQYPEETDEHFLYRISRSCHQMIQEVKFENKYGVDINKDPDTGKVSVTKKPQDESKDLTSRKEKKERRKRKLEEIKKAKLEKHRDDFEKFQDNVKFGETVHAPPTLKTLPKKADPKTGVPRPGQKDLLLKSMLLTKSEPTFMAKKMKRKTLPLATQQQMEKQRIQAVEAYRRMKTQKHNFMSVNS